MNKLRNELSAKLFYHSIYHTLDVYHSAESIAIEEGVSDSDMKLLLVGAIYHDAGYLKQNNNHEEISCIIAREYLPLYHYSKKDIDIICGIIMATKIPQTPKTHLEEIISDADLNYLGRTDFFEIGEYLYNEMLAFGYINNRDEWNKIQLNFMLQHHYFTATAIKKNQSLKEKNLKEVQLRIK
ncbi:HD domain-containing protein [Flavobacterium cellulosilyticum]|uniref:HD domain-containing protein n=1 Tax=Flavobacterium cellulosilyticum TaxID=2541731 RepID=UPI0014046E98|nr:HD domain-containing protein [Flavobacterium cellulosilyticum]